MAEKSEVIVLGEQHELFARTIDDLLTGGTIVAVEYHGLDPDLENESGLTLAEMDTCYPQIDTLDFGLILRTDQGHFHITWDSTFYTYGLIVTRLSDDAPNPSYGTVIEASHRPPCSMIIGKVILGADITWDKIIYTDSDRSYVYPQWLRIRHSQGALYLSASEILRNDPIATGFMDNILVTADRDSAVRILQFPQTAA